MEHLENGVRVQTRPDRAQDRRFVIALPEPNVSLNQDQEWCVVRIDDQWREIRFHDYGEVYDIEGLYEHLFYTTLGCNSPEVIVGLLRRQMKASGADPGELRVLDLGAGNGMVGEVLQGIGVRTIVGVDIVSQAAHAVERDRPGIYDDYLIADMTQLTEEEHSTLQSYRFNGLTCVAALGFGDIPTEAFRNSFNLVEDGGWIAFNIRDRFLEDREPSGFSRLIQTMIERGTLEIVAQEKYIHRHATDGTPLDYFAVVARKRGDA